MHHPNRKPRTPAAGLFKPSPEAPVPAMKNHHHNGPIHPTSREAIHQMIAVRAHNLWERDGCPEDRAEATWLEAERELLATQKWNQSSPTLPVSF